MNRIILSMFALIALHVTSYAQATWEKVNSFDTDAIFRGGTAENGNLILPVYDDGIHYSTDGGQSWTKSTGIPATSYTALLSTKEHGLWVGTLTSIYFSSDHGVTWAERNSGRFSYYPKNIAYDAHNGIMAFDEISIFKYNEQQLRWNETSYPSEQDISIQFGATTPDGNIIIGMQDPKAIWVSENGGATWARNSNTFNDYYGYISVADDASFMIGGRDTIYYAPSYNQQWQKWDIPFGWRYISSVHTVAIGQYYFACDNGVFRTLDNGATWEKYNQGLISDGLTIRVYDLFTDDNNVLYACTENGLYKTSAPVVGLHSPLPAGDEGITAMYPNPGISGKSVQVTCTLNIPQYITYRLYDLFGRIVEERHIHIETSGQSVVDIALNGKRGMYFLQLETQSGHLYSKQIPVMP